MIRVLHFGFLSFASNHLNTCAIAPQTLRHPAVLKYVADGESETTVMLATERAETMVSHLERIRDDEEMTKKQMYVILKGPNILTPS